MTSRLHTPRKTAAGLGAAKSGTAHFIAQRVTALALVPLVVWFLVALVTAFQRGYAGARDFVADPLNAVLLLLLVTAAFHHMQLGLQVVIEDYIERHGARAALLILNVFAAFALWVVAAVSILKIAI
jgi:succinate dehydrogenase / fumarate reductase membrane anchor subunit